LLIVVGGILCLFGVVPLIRYALDYQILSNYGQGYVWGKAIILLVGVVCIVIGSRLKKASA
jgi:multisubunit Na+/H+ antiporter MnhG subunit